MRVEVRGLEEEYQRRRKSRIRELKRRRKRVERIRRMGISGAGAAAAALLVFALSQGTHAKGESGVASTVQRNRWIEFTDENILGNRQTESYGPPLPEGYGGLSFAAYATDHTEGFGESILSQYGIVIDVEQGTILAHREGQTRMNPASMTKILTVLTAAEALGLKGDDWKDSSLLEDTLEITMEVTDYCFVNGCSVVGFERGEAVKVRDMFYGTILSSGADAALALAIYTSGSHEDFVELMNQKLEDMGLSETTHFTNCVGIYDAEHYSTAYDIAVILKAASENPLCREVLSAHTYVTCPNEVHSEGMPLSNWFLRRIEDKDTRGVVLCGKTGYVTESGSCAASLAVDSQGREYLCVTAGASSSAQCLADQEALYQRYLTADV